MSDDRLPVRGAGVLYKATEVVTMADLSVHTSHLGRLLRTCLAEAGLRCSRRWRRHTEWVGRVRDVQRSFVRI